MLLGGLFRGFWRAQGWEGRLNPGEPYRGVFLVASEYSGVRRSAGLLCLPLVSSVSPLSFRRKQPTRRGCTMPFNCEQRGSSVPELPKKQSSGDHRLETAPRASRDPGASLVVRPWETLTCVFPGREESLLGGCRGLVGPARHRGARPSETPPPHFGGSPREEAAQTQPFPPAGKTRPVD